MSSLNFNDKMAEAKKRLKYPEQAAGMDLLQFSTITNSGARKILASTQRQQIFSLMRPEPPIIGTGYDNRFGDYSSSLLKTDTNYKVVAKISKFSQSPNHHYWLILESLSEKKLIVVERIAYHYITESYGYLYDNTYLDSLIPSNPNRGVVIPAGQVIQKSLAFDEYNNRCDGVNLNVAYMALDDNMEDSEIISDEAAAKMVSPLIKVITVPINENDIPLNMYGNNEVYKAIPNIGEKIRDDGVVLALRKERKEEALYTQSVDRLREILLTDDKRLATGVVVDINIYCNNIEHISDSEYMSQFKYYYDDLRRYSHEFVSIITPYVANGYTMSYELQKLYGSAKRVLNRDQYAEKNGRPFSNMMVDIIVLEELPLNVGDKVTNAYGSKGVISNIRPKAMMPRLTNGVYADVILNSSGMYNRENPGQIFELSLNYIGHCIVDFIKLNSMDIEDSFNMVLDFIESVSEIQYNELKDWGCRVDDEGKAFFLESIIEEGYIHIAAKPISEAFTIDKLNEVYQKFPWIKPMYAEVPITDSNGNIRYIQTKRPMVIAKQYMFRLKQFAEEKFSATSLSATNIRNQNTKSRASRDYREMYSNTPIRAGSMEIDNESSHLGAEYVVANLMLHSVSPHGRLLVEQFYTQNPFNIDIKLDSQSSNRSAEEVNTYLKTMGLRLRFIKVKKYRPQALKFDAIYFKEDVKSNAIFFNNEKDFDFVRDYQNRVTRKKQNALKFDAIRFY